jgi:CheY-like chemotaxis protein
MAHNAALDPPQPPDRDAHVLLVDDDESWSHAASEILRRAGYEVLLAPDYRKALEILESDRRVDLLLTDIVMPKRINGVALGRMARMRRGGLPLLYMTAYDIPGLAAETEDVVLLKPISEVDLVCAVERALAGSSGAE